MRYTAESNINPLRVTTSGSLYPVLMSVYEIAFWAHRVNLVNIAGTIHSGLNIFAVNFNAPMYNLGATRNCSDEVDSYLNGTYDIAHTQTVLGDFCTVQFQFGGAYVYNDETHWFPNLVFSVTTSAGEVSSIPGLGAGTVGASFHGADLVVGGTYNTTIPMYGAGPTGALTITPASFWDFGNIYDVSTGARA